MPLTSSTNQKQSGAYFAVAALYLLHRHIVGSQALAIVENLHDPGLHIIGRGIEATDKDEVGRRYHIIGQQQRRGLH
jgi:hypothetical protein